MSFQEGLAVCKTLISPSIGQIFSLFTCSISHLDNHLFQVYIQDIFSAKLSVESIILFEELPRKKYKDK